MGNGHKVAACLYAQLRLLGEPEPWGNSCSWIVSQGGKCQKKHPRLVFHSFFIPYPCPLDTSQFLQHHFVEGAFIIGGVTLRKEAGGGNPITWKHGAHVFSKLFHPRGSTSFGFNRYSFTASGACGLMQRGAGSPGPCGRARWLAHPPQLRQPHDSPSLGTKPAQASGM